MTFGMTLVVLLVSFSARGAERTLTGKISDSICTSAHKSVLEHGGQKLSAHDCTLACVKKGGKYVLVSQGKVYQIVNQDFDGLEPHAGQSVTLTGELLGDHIKVSRIGGPSRKVAKT